MLSSLPGAFGGATGCFQFWEPGGVLPRTQAFGTEEVFGKSFLDYYGDINPYKDSWLGTAPRGRIIFANEFVPTEVITQTEFYADWMEPQGITSDHFGLVFSSDPQPNAIIAIAPHASVYGKRRDLYTGRLLSLAPHLTRSIELARQLGEQRQIVRAQDRGLDRLGMAAFVLRLSGRVIHANGQAEAMLRDRQVVGLRPDRSIGASDATAAPALEAAIAAAWASADRVGPPVKLRAKRGDAAFWAWLVPSHPFNPAAGEGWAGRLEAMERGATLLLLVTPAGNGRAEIPVDLIAMILRLTPAEAALTAALVSGLSLAEYAARSDLARNTLKSQLASVFGKTGANRQAELVAHVLAVLGPFARGY